MYDVEHDNIQLFGYMVNLLLSWFLSSLCMAILQKVNLSKNHRINTVYVLINAVDQVAGALTLFYYICVYLYLLIVPNVKLLTVGSFVKATKTFFRI